MQFASTWVAKKLIKLREVKSRDQLISIATGHRGHVFECLGQSLLSNLAHKKVAVRMLSDESESEITIPDVTVPKSSISVVDAYGRLDNGCIVVFNFTVNLKHEIASKKLNEFLRGVPKPGRILYVCVDSSSRHSKELQEWKYKNLL